MRHMLRYYIPPSWKDDDLWRLIHTCEKLGAHELLLFTTSYDQQPSFVPLADVQGYVDKMLVWAAVLRARGLTVSLNVMSTLGHIYYPHATEENFGFQRRTDLDGLVSQSSACPLDTKLLEYQRSAYAKYAEVRPRLLFLDDDVRFPAGRRLDCFCPLHLELYRDALGSSDLTLDDLRVQFLGGAGTESRDAVFAVMEDSLVEFVSQLRMAVHEISPSTQLGIMAANVPYGWWGTDILRVAQALVGPALGAHVPIIRPQTPVYSDVLAQDLPKALLQAPMLAQVYAGRARMYPEIESYPFTQYSKSNVLTLMQLVVSHLHGLDDMTLDLFDFSGGPFSNYHSLISALEENHAYLAGLAEIVKGCRAEGVRIYAHPRSLVHRRNLDESGLIDPRNFDNWLPNLGVPVGFDWDTSPFTFLAGDDISAASDAEVDRLLSRGVVADARALECLVASGHGDRIGIGVDGDVAFDSIGLESFDNANWSPTHSGEFQTLRFVAQEGDFRQLTVPATAQIASYLVDYSIKRVGPAVVLNENAAGERFAALAYTGRSHQKTSFVCDKRPEQMRRVFEWVARTSLPAAALDAPFVWPVLMASARCSVIGLFNLSYDDLQSITFTLPRAASSSVRMMLDPSGELIDAFRFLEDVDHNGTAALCLTHHLPALGWVVLVFGHGGVTGQMESSL